MRRLELMIRALARQFGLDIVERICEECNGQGEVHGRDDRGDDVMVECPKCFGAGVHVGIFLLTAELGQEEARRRVLRAVGTPYGPPAFDFEKGHTLRTEGTEGWHVSAKEGWDRTVLDHIKETEPENFYNHILGKDGRVLGEAKLPELCVRCEHNKRKEGSNVCEECWNMAPEAGGPEVCEHCGVNEAAPGRVVCDGCIVNRDREGNMLVRARKVGEVVSEYTKDLLNRRQFTDVAFGPTESEKRALERLSEKDEEEEELVVTVPAPIEAGGWTDGPVHDRKERPKVYWKGVVETFQKLPQVPGTNREARWVRSERRAYVFYNDRWTRWESLWDMDPRCCANCYWFTPDFHGNPHICDAPLLVGMGGPPEYNDLCRDAAGWTPMAPTAETIISDMNREAVRLGVEGEPPSKVEINYYIVKGYFAERFGLKVSRSGKLNMEDWENGSVELFGLPVFICGWTDNELNMMPGWRVS